MVSVKEVEGCEVGSTAARSSSNSSDDVTFWTIGVVFTAAAAEMTVGPIWQGQYYFRGKVTLSAVHIAATTVQHRYGSSLTDDDDGALLWRHTMT